MAFGTDETVECLGAWQTYCDQENVSGHQCCKAGPHFGF